MFFPKYAPNALRGGGCQLVYLAQNFQLLQCILFKYFLDSCCDCSRRFNLLWVVVVDIIHEIKSLEVQVRWMRCHWTSHCLLISLSWNRSLSYPKKSFDVWGWPRFAGTPVHLGVVPVIPRASPLKNFALWWSLTTLKLCSKICLHYGVWFVGEIGFHTKRLFLGWLRHVAKTIIPIFHARNSTCIAWKIRAIKFDSFIQRFVGSVF